MKEININEVFLLDMKEYLIESDGFNEELAFIEELEDFLEED